MNYSKADALAKVLGSQSNPDGSATTYEQDGQPLVDPQADVSLWDKIKALFSQEGKQWADTADSMLPEELSARQAILRKQQQEKLLEELNRSQ